MYWVFWGIASVTLLTWVFAVAAAADDAWWEWSNPYGTAESGELGQDCSGWDCDLCKRVQCRNVTIGQARACCLCNTQLFSVSFGTCHERRIFRLSDERCV